MSEVKNLNLSELDVVVESRLGFQPNITQENGMCLGKVTKCELVEREHPLIKEDGTPSNYEYKGLKTVALLLEFEQINFDPKDTSKRYYTHTEKVISGYAKNGELITNKSFNDLLIASFNRMQHIVNSLDNAKLSPLSSKFSGATPAINDSAEIKANKFKKLFEHFALQIKGKSKDAEAKPRYDGVILWLKIVADYSSGKYYGFPQYVRKGFVQVAQKGVPCSLVLDPSESLELTSKAKQTTSKDMSKPATEDAPASVDDVLAGILGK